ncbi:MAG: type II toxin-antitoxin system VapC family toxin [Alphaproteobacteria bacterium]|nr:type II toxin-antitoxin system VapC family toxin [Alphaproteobacteria bacterium]
MVLDASALIEVLLRMPAAAAVEARIGAQATLQAPHLLDIEVAQVLRRFVSAGIIGQERGKVALADLAVYPLLRYPHGQLLQRVWELRGNLTAYDAAYVALAEALDVPLLTRDRRIAAAAGHAARIYVV